jgi:hypothetical protein
MRKPDPSYRNFLIRSAAGLAGDMAVATALVQVCIWITQVAALGLFLQFMLWLLAALIALALSQYLIHPLVNVLLAEDKLTRTGRAIAELRRGFEKHVVPAAKNTPWADVLDAALKRKRA